MIPAGFEPATVRLEGECSIQLSYGTLTILFYIKQSTLSILCQYNKKSKKCIDKQSHMYYTSYCSKNGPLVKGLRHRLFTAVTRVRIPYGLFLPP